MKLACISIDLDELIHYERIHGLPETAKAGATVHALAGQRFGELMRRHDLVGTAFVIGESLRHGAAAEAARTLGRAGHEIGNHSLHHDYGLIHRSTAQMQEELEGGAEAIARATGARPEGFRAPGYNVSEPLLARVAATGHRYDASVLPSAPYLGARAAVIGALSLTRSPSRSVVGRPEMALAPTRPYRPDPEAFWKPGDGPLWELPMSVVPVTRVPFIGTMVNTMPWGLVRAGYRALARGPWLSLELHGIDLMDMGDPIPRHLDQRQKDLKVPLGEKLRRLDELLGWIKQDFDVVTLADAARRA